MKKILKILIFLLLIPWVYALILIFVNPPITITQLSNLSYGFSRTQLAYDEIPASAKWAVIAAEDQNFAIHNGFDFKEIKTAYEKNKAGKKLRGGSTLSQQTAKNVFLWQGRTWIRKGLETYCTFIIETLWSKERILQVYLNNAEMGKGVYGIEAAAQYYFKKNASQLTPTETARIIACLPNPKKYNVNPPSAYISKRGQWILRQVRNLKGDSALSQIVNTP
ncbi:monofunctional biosynthetic peptidoglycan transglycosylase [Ornithobacterium rhinotracheale]|uniref:monofunctional biosynthetic peptidoglycan transglycosylase n=1 Tax=Ornithobacterium rhinotracheale TaxID=28251 RepID=UPI001FF162A9|nr:monofunctional biosynthetic peptidoglycan transglycosylase [Ornithobacterium rhinotracheale]MCK0200300.1 monofunctional biosynthetic peptidoglycan transglycosylase [Ornithobacterium rhinotracheale]MCK0205018.1 monofunctional biosynthetic peptidoglycan transglycosylase [Ornithobacterium rhinotracheale]UVD87976.1 monofunctional biosynthetic peptidoglycan transglycosylase [Ornithobacterium rhinotracheale]